jgi:hypothetical protein
MRESASQPEVVEPVRLPFDTWWILVSTANNLSQNLKEPLKCHFRARGFWNDQDWDAGLRDFGL